ncbi:MAG TPA: peptidase T [Gaiellaceae bacterium]|nr:peptidase T [Gaiellaceae bacterium]
MPLPDELRADTLERFLRYVRIDTQSDHFSETFPSTPGQLDLSRLLAEELRGLGLADVELTGQGYVYATLPGAPGAPVVGLVAHVDVAPDVPGNGVKPVVHEAYAGGELVAGLSPESSPLLAERLGHDIVTSDGTTLLGADDKAGVAEIMAAVAHLARNPEPPHATLRVGFTVDEETGHGTDGFDVARFGADFAYTLDGSEVGEIENETFSAVELKVTFPGVAVHPGTAKGKLVNPVKLAAALVERLPKDTLSPETTEGREGYVHPLHVEGHPDACTVVFLLRDHDDAKLAEHEELVRRLALEVSPEASFERWEQYRNMRARLDEVPHVLDAALEAARRVGLEPSLAAIRGGTDGSRLTELGLPTPNLYTGGNEFHSLREWISVQDMALSAATVVELLRLWAEPEWVARARP